MPEIPEPPEDTIVAWWDSDGGLYAVASRTDAHVGIGGETFRWFLADNGASGGEPLEWWELLTEMDGFRGPSELVSKGRLEGRAS